MPYEVLACLLLQAAAQLDVDELTKATKDDELLPLGSVGGTILYIKASPVRQGVNFPTSYVLRTTWSHEGWAEIKSEGVCYSASHIKGGGCFVGW
ncbi:hypothetical protein AAE478_008687 [Parahypoxylon ruwenzoriense]